MRDHFHCWLSIAGLLALPSCGVVATSNSGVPGAEVRRMIESRTSAVVVDTPKSMNSANIELFKSGHVPKDIEGGSAVPITSDGYFLTANHVLPRSEHRGAYLLYGVGSAFRMEKARVVWSDEGADLMLLHAPMRTPVHYEWTSPELKVKSGTKVTHGGLSTGKKLPPGQLIEDLWPVRSFMGYRKFKMDLQLEPGDSGGPVVDGNGNLVGINSAVEYIVPMQTAFFVDSEASRPNTTKLQRLIDADRMSHANASSTAHQ